MHSVAEAVARIIEGIAPLAVESVGLSEALGRVLATDTRSPITLPHWENSAMDGYAVRGVDIAGASADSPITLPVVETIAAGAFPTRALGAGEATRIMTGAPIPEGADTVVWLAADDGAPLAERGRFWCDRRVRAIHRLPSTRRSDTPERRAALWARCVELAGVDPDR